MRELAVDCKSPHAHRESFFMAEQHVRSVHVYNHSEHTGMKGEKPGSPLPFCFRTASIQLVANGYGCIVAGLVENLSF
jgi:hypothetical protein